MILAVSKLIELLSVNVASEYIDELIPLAIKSLNNPQATNQSKISSCNILKVLALNLKQVADLIVPHY